MLSSEHKNECNTEVDGNTKVVNLNKNRSRAWVFTAYEEDYDKVDCFLRDKKFTYWIYQHEVCPTTGREHRQGAFRLQNAISFSALKEVCKSWHIEPTRSESHAFKYCCKEETRKSGTKTVMFGSPPKMGKRSDLVSLAQCVREGKDDKQIAEEYPSGFIRYNKGILALRSALSTYRVSKPIVRWYYGSAGSGKTFAAVGLDEDYYIKDGTQWWDGYRPGQHVIIDDFDGKWPFRDFLRILDRYKYQGQVKGGYVKINSNITITCEFHPRKFWKNNELDQVLRRIDEIKNMDYCKQNLEDLGITHRAPSAEPGGLRPPGGILPPFRKSQEDLDKEGDGLLQEIEKE